jgi:transposase
MREIMVGKRTKFSASFKVEAVKLVIEGSRPIAEVARELGYQFGDVG